MQKKIAAVHDISGFGRCALTTAIPILSACGLHCCVVPSAVLSAHTAFKGVTFRDLTDDLNGFINNWADIGVKVDAIYSGYLGSEHQVKEVLHLKEACGKPDSVLIVDPVMGDNGKAYSIAKDKAFIDSIRELCSQADIVTPNLTECALLLGMEPDGYKDDRDSALEYMKRLAEMGAKKIVITGLSEDYLIGAGFYDSETEKSGFVFHEHVPTYFPGTGDLFTSTLAGVLLREERGGLEAAVSDAAHFVMECAKYTEAAGTPPIEGVQFEMFLNKLIKQG